MAGVMLRCYFWWDFGMLGPRATVCSAYPWPPLTHAAVCSANPWPPLTHEPAHSAASAACGCVLCLLMAASPTRASSVCAHRTLVHTVPSACSCVPCLQVSLMRKLKHDNIVSYVGIGNYVPDSDEKQRETIFLVRCHRPGSCCYLFCSCSWLFLLAALPSALLCMQSAALCHACCLTRGNRGGDMKCFVFRFQPFSDQLDKTQWLYSHKSI